MRVLCFSFVIIYFPRCNSGCKLENLYTKSVVQQINYLKFRLDAAFNYVRTHNGVPVACVLHGIRHQHHGTYAMGGWHNSVLSRVRERAAHLKKNNLTAIYVVISCKSLTSLSKALLLINVLFLGFGVVCFVLLQDHISDSAKKVGNEYSIYKSLSPIITTDLNHKRVITKKVSADHRSANLRTEIDGMPQQLASSYLPISIVHAYLTKVNKYGYLGAAPYGPVEERVNPLPPAFRSFHFRVPVLRHHSAGEPSKN